MHVGYIIKKITWRMNLLFIYIHAGTVMKVNIKAQENHGSHNAKWDIFFSIIILIIRVLIQVRLGLVDSNHFYSNFNQTFCLEKTIKDCLDINHIMHGFSNKAIIRLKKEDHEKRKEQSFDGQRRLTFWIFCSSILKKKEWSAMSKRDLREDVDTFMLGGLYRRLCSPQIQAWDFIWNIVREMQ